MECVVVTASCKMVPKHQRRHHRCDSEDTLTTHTSNSYFIILLQQHMIRYYIHRKTAMERLANDIDAVRVTDMLIRRCPSVFPVLTPASCATSSYGYNVSIGNSTNTGPVHVTHVSSILTSHSQR